MAMTQAEMIEQLEQAYQRIDDALETLNEAQLLADDVRNALTDEHPGYSPRPRRGAVVQNGGGAAPRESTGDSARCAPCAVLYDLPVLGYQIPAVVGDTTGK